MRLLGLFLGFVFSLEALFRAPVTQVAQNNNRFALSFYSELVKQHPRSNLVFSPYGLSSAMGIAYLAAGDQMGKDLSQVLFFPLDAKIMGESFKRMNQDLSTDKGLGVASSLWVQENLNFKSDFLEQVNSYYEGRFHQVDFEIRVDSSRSEINSWVEKKTGTRSPALSVSDMPRSTKMLLLATCTLKAGWDVPFNLKDSQSLSFVTSQGAQRPTTFMKAQGEYAYYETDEEKVVEIPYAVFVGQLPRLGFWIVLPKGPAGLEAFENQLSFDKFNEWRVQAVKKLVSLAIPRFRINQIHNFNDTFVKLGLPEPFSPGADFSRMSDSPQVFIAKTLQKTLFFINEKGSDAPPYNAPVPPAAKPLTHPEGILQFHANRPFLFFVLDNTSGQILFLGRVVTP